MKARQILSAFVVLAAIAATPAGAATDTRLVAQGTATLAEGSPAVNCTGPVVITFIVQSNQALYTENWGPGSPGQNCALGTLTAIGGGTTANPTIRQCVPPYGGIIIPGYTLSQTGTVYTVQSTVQYCTGGTAVDKIVVTVRATNISFTHTYTERNVLLIRATGTIPRLA